jgi:hypothetical protein
MAVSVVRWFFCLCTALLLLSVSRVDAGRQKADTSPTAQPTVTVITQIDEKGIGLIGEPWVISHQKGVMRGQSLTFQQIQHPTNHAHSCYRVICNGKHCPGENETAVMDMCYPSVIVTGLPKCGTSAMYDLLARFPGALVMHEKENCPYTRRRSHWLFFSSFPKFETIHNDSIIIDGCIDVINNMKMRQMLHFPNTYYIVSRRPLIDCDCVLWL